MKYIKKFSEYENSINEGITDSIKTAVKKTKEYIKQIYDKTKREVIKIGDFKLKSPKAYTQFALDLKTKHMNLMRKAKPIKKKVNNIDKAMDLLKEFNDNLKKSFKTDIMVYFSVGVVL